MYHYQSYEIIDIFNKTFLYFLLLETYTPQYYEGVSDEENYKNNLLTL